jgi:hypothetical protein
MKEDSSRIPKLAGMFSSLSLIIPLMGIVLGIVYLVRRGKGAKKFGVVCLILAFSNIVTIFSIKIIFFFFYIPLFYLVYLCTGTMNTL